MKNSLIFLILIFFGSKSFAQSNCPNETLIGKWTNGEFGIEITCDKYFVLNKINNWAQSDRKIDIYYILQPIITNDADTFISWVQNYAMYDVYSQGKWSQTSSVQQRIFKIEKKDDDKIKFSMSEKKINPDGLGESATVDIIKKEQIFEKSFVLKRISE